MCNCSVVATGLGLMQHFMHRDLTIPKRSILLICFEFIHSVVRQASVSCSKMYFTT